jgi:hypothetical protein
MAVGMTVEMIMPMRVVVMMMLGHIAKATVFGSVGNVPNVRLRNG